MVAHALGEVLALSAQQRQSLVCAALSMNVAMTSVQNELALQQFGPSPSLSDWPVAKRMVKILQTVTATPPP